MRKFFLLTWFSHCLLLLTPLIAWSQTSVGGSVHGTWTSDGNPYNVISTVIVNWGDTLTIKPGVEVHFTGPDSFLVYGTLRAEGVYPDPIIFTGADTLAWPWQGIMFMNGSSDSSFLEYVHIENPEKGVVTDFCAPAIRYSTIKAQSIGVKAFYSNLYILNSTIKVDGEEVIGIYLYQSDAIMRSDSINVTIPVPYYGVTARGIQGVQSDPDIRNSIIVVESQGESRGMDFVYAGKAEIRYNLICVSSTIRACGVFLSHSLFPNFINNTIFVQSEQMADKCFHLLDNSNPKIENCILYGDGTSQGVYAGSFIDPTILYCDVYNHSNNYVGCQPDTGCFSLDPDFLNPWLLDFHLSSSSPCIDRGNPDSPPDPDGTRADIGCYYFHQTGVISPLINLPVDQGVMEVFPNPFNAVAHLRLVLPLDQRGYLAIYDHQGRRITSIKNGLIQAGEYRFNWNAGDAGSGIYWAVLKTDHSNLVYRLVLVK